MKVRFIAFMLLMGLVASADRAGAQGFGGEEPTEDEVRLKSGRVLKGEVVRRFNDRISFKMGNYGVFDIRLDDIEELAIDGEVSFAPTPTPRPTPTPLPEKEFTFRTRLGDDSHLEGIMGGEEEPAKADEVTTASVQGTAPMNMADMWEIPEDAASSAADEAAPPAPNLSDLDNLPKAPELPPADAATAEAVRAALQAMRDAAATGEGSSSIETYVTAEAMKNFQGGGDLQFAPRLNAEVEIGEIRSDGRIAMADFRLPENVGGALQPEKMAMLLRNVEGQWKFYGMAIKLTPDLPQTVLDFEQDRAQLEAQTMALIEPLMAQMARDAGQNFQSDGDAGAEALQPTETPAAPPPGGNPFQ